MEIFGSILTVIFIGFLLATTLTFGFILLIWFVGVAVMLSLCMFARDFWRRLYFLRHAAPPENDSKVTDAEFVEISYKEESH